MIDKVHVREVDILWLFIRIKCCCLEAYKISLKRKMIFISTILHPWNGKLFIISIIILMLISIRSCMPVLMLISIVRILNRILIRQISIKLSRNTIRIIILYSIFILYFIFIIYFINIINVDCKWVNFK